MPHEPHSQDRSASATMEGWTPPPRRVGVLLPASDSCLEQELPVRLAGVASIHSHRLPLSSVTEPGLRALSRAALDALPLLMACHPDALVFGCTSGTFLLGREHEAELVAELSARTGVPVVTAARAVVNQLRRHGTRVRLRAPYLDSIVEAEARYLTREGFEVTSSRALGIVDDEETARLDSATLADFVRGDDAVDAVLLSCTNVRSLGFEHKLAEAAGAPVITSTAAVAAAVRAALDQ